MAKMKETERAVAAAKEVESNHIADQTGTEQIRSFKIFVLKWQDKARKTKILLECQAIVVKMEI